MSSPNKVTTREQLIYLLSQGANLEHSLICQYLFTAFSLKQATTEGVTDAQLKLIEGWRRTLYGIAIQEMLHLAQVSNLLTAIGGAPNFQRDNFPQAKTYTSLGLTFKLSAFSDKTIARYICFEKPQKPGPWDQFCAGIEARLSFLALPVPVVPFDIDYKTIAELYGLIESGVDTIPDLFIGPPSAQAGDSVISGLIKVTDKASADEAIQNIIVQGEGTPEGSPDSHYGKFKNIYDELEKELANDPNFQPSRPVIDNPILYLRKATPTPGANIITEPTSRDVGEIFVGSYETMLQLLTRFFAHISQEEVKPGQPVIGENAAQLAALADAAVNIMTQVVLPLGPAMTLLPAGQAHPGQNAGPSFEIYNNNQLLPQISSAWLYFNERLRLIAGDAHALSQDPQTPKDLASVLAGVETALQDIAKTLVLKTNGGGAVVSYDKDIKPLFRGIDVNHMAAQGLDLSSYDDVKSNAQEIYNRLTTTNQQRLMPPASSGGPWSADKIAKFKQWMDDGYQP
jgi:hypothetical protein